MYIDYDKRYERKRVLGFEKHGWLRCMYKVRGEWLKKELYRFGNELKRARP
jgi:hypothetical protein